MSTKNRGITAALRKDLDWCAEDVDYEMYITGRDARRILFSLTQERSEAAKTRTELLAIADRTGKHIGELQERIRVLEQWKEAADTLLEEVSFGVAQWGIKNVPPVPRRWLERVEDLRLAGEKLLPEGPAAASEETR